MLAPNCDSLMYPYVYQNVSFDQDIESTSAAMSFIILLIAIFISLVQSNLSFSLNPALSVSNLSMSGQLGHMYRCENWLLLQIYVDVE